MVDESRSEHVDSNALQQRITEVLGKVEINLDCPSGFRLVADANIAEPNLGIWIVAEGSPA